MPFNFEKFTDTEASFAARVTVRQTGQFGFNTGAINRFRLKDFENAVLYFDPELRVVGIEMTNEKCEGAIEIKKSDTNTYIRSKNFCDRYSIDYSDSHRFELRQDSESGYLYFDLNQELTKDSSPD